MPAALGMRYDIRPLTISHLDECWRLDQRCFVDGEAYSRETFEYLLTAPESVAYRAATPSGDNGRVLLSVWLNRITPDTSPRSELRRNIDDDNLAKRLMARG